jgi:hypothetical protein
LPTSPDGGPDGLQRRTAWTSRPNSTYRDRRRAVDSTGEDCRDAYRAAGVLAACEHWRVSAPSEENVNRWKICALAAAALWGFTLANSQPRVASAEPQPRLEAALRHLREAREELSRAIPNKGGHRERALEFTDQAIRQVEEGIAVGNRR